MKVAARFKSCTSDGEAISPAEFSRACRMYEAATGSATVPCLERCYISGGRTSLAGVWVVLLDEDARWLGEYWISTSL
jgi:hypothetical protein